MRSKIRNEISEDFDSHAQCDSFFSLSLVFPLQINTRNFVVFFTQNSFYQVGSSSQDSLISQFTKKEIDKYEKNVFPTLYLVDIMLITILTTSKHYLRCIFLLKVLYFRRYFYRFHNNQNSMKCL